MKTSRRLHFLISLVTVGFGCDAIYGGDVQQFQTNHDSFELTGVWVLQMRTSGAQVSIGIKNVGQTPVKAFRASLLKTNDFDESEETLTLEYSSESQYVTEGRKESHHILLVGETLFYNIGSTDELHSQTYFSSVSLIRGLVAMGSKESVKDQEKMVDALLVDARFLLKITKVVQAEAKDLSAMRDRPIETPRSPRPISKEELAEEQYTPQK
jgi:hypothetical protein